MLLPLFLWALTGVIFLIKPGYTAAYEKISPKFYPITKPLIITPNNTWEQIKYYKTVLGEHLIVYQNRQWQHLDPTTMAVWPLPSTQEMTLLIQDAISTNKDRYGKIESIKKDAIYMNTGVVITLDWSTLSLKQKGRDTSLINTLYKVHYLQWFGNAVIDKILGVLGIVFLFFLTLFGLLMLVQKNKSDG